MEFDFSEEQRALADTVRRFVERDYGFERRRAIVAGADGWSRDAWRTLAEIGVTAINVPEPQGGLGYGAIEAGLVAATLGPALSLEPFIAAAVVAPTALCRAGDTGFAGEWLPRIAAGEAIVVLADDAAGHGAPTANPGSGDWRLDGRIAAVSHAGAADLLLVPAPLPDGKPGLFAVEATASGLIRHAYPTLDGHRAADIELSGAIARRVGGDAAEAIAAARDAGLCALCWEAVGILDAAIAATAEYLRTRRQFGQPIGRFQALQHRMADMLLHAEQARSMSYLAAAHCADEDRMQRQRVLSAAKVTVGQACRFVAQAMVQLHGGMGMTDELIVSHWFKRLTAIEMSAGDSDYHLMRFAQQSRMPS